MKNKFCQGAISIFLCLILTPLLTIACMLVEMSRYQGLIASLNAIADCASLSTLANYDSYIEDRFGLFAISQDCDISEEFDAYYSSNVEMLGNQVSLNSTPTAKGVFPLSNNTILRQQVLDFAESTDLTAFLLSDMNLEEILEKLNGLKSLNTLADTAGKLVTLTEKIQALVTAAETLKSTVESIISQINTIGDKATALVDDLEALYDALEENSFEFDSELVESFNNLVKDFEDEIDDVYTSGSDLYYSFNSLYTNLTSISGQVTALQNALEEANDALEAVTESNESLKNADYGETADGSEASGSNAGETVDESTSIFEAVLGELEKAVDEAVDDLSKSVIEEVKSAANGVKEELVDYFNIGRYVNYDTYFSLPLSDEAKGDLKDIMSLVWNGSSKETILQTLKDKFVPNLRNFTSIKNTINQAVEDAKDKLVKNLEDKLASILTNLVTAIRNLFDLDVFFNGDLNAYLSASAASTLAGLEDNPYNTFLTALETMFDAVDQFVKGIKNANFVQVIKATKTLFNAVEDTVRAITQLVDSLITKIKEVCGYFTGSGSNFYELLLISAYMTHNLPNRTSVGDGAVDSNLIYNVGLKGKTLTGYSYNDIPLSKTGSSPVFKGLSGLVSFVGNAFNGGSDDMFKGAELEYIIAGTKSEVLNQAITFFDLYFLRLIMDIPAVMTDPNVATMAGAATIASWVVYILVLIAEPLVDTVLIVNGKEEYVIKKGCYMCPAGIGKLVKALIEVGVNNSTVENSLNKLAGDSAGSFTEGGVMKIGYSTYVMLALMLTVSEEDMITRLGNLIQLECNKKYDSFSLSKAYTGITVSIDADFNQFISVFEFSDSSVLGTTIHKTRTY